MSVTKSIYQYLTYCQKEPCSPVIASTKKPHFVEKSVQEHGSSSHDACTYTKEKHIGCQHSSNYPLWVYSCSTMQSFYAVFTAQVFAKTASVYVYIDRLSRAWWCRHAPHVLPQHECSLSMQHCCPPRESWSLSWEDVQGSSFRVLVPR